MSTEIKILIFDKFFKYSAYLFFVAVFFFSEIAYYRSSYLKKKID